MCGVIGIIGLEPVIDRLYSAALRLANRGKNATGFATFNGENLNYLRGRGTADQALEANHPDHFKTKKEFLSGNSGIAHTRYPTSGANSDRDFEKNAQPIYEEGIITCSNGDTLNLIEMREKLERRGHFFNTDVDSKLLQFALLDEMKMNGIDIRGSDLSLDKYANRLFKSVEEVNKEILGAWSCLNLMPRGLLAFKDPHGIKPLCWGKRYGKRGKLVEVAFFSESSVFNMFTDYKDIREVGPGEAIFVETDTLEIRTERISPLEKSFCFFEHNYFAIPDSKIDGMCVEDVRYRHGVMLAEENRWLKDVIDCVVPVPATAVPAADAIAQVLGIKKREAIRKIKEIRSFQEPSQEKREEAIEDKFIFIKEWIKGKTLLVTDDSNVRGNTARMIAQKLYDLGAEKVYYAFFTPPIISSCPYGIDTPEKDKLVAYRHIANEKTKRIDIHALKKDMFSGIRVDGKPLPSQRQPEVIYISREGMYLGLRRPEGKGICTGCITGCYPHSSNPKFNDYMSQREEMRKNHRARC